MNKKIKIKIPILLLLVFLLCSCSSNNYEDTNAKAIDGVPDEVIYEHMEWKYNSPKYNANDSSTWSRPTYTNDINIYEQNHTKIDNELFLVELKAIVNSDICTKEVEVQCKYELRDGDWWIMESNHNIINTEWHYSNFENCWWVGGAGLGYRAFFITNINTENRTMGIIDMNNREYSTNYEVLEDASIRVNVKYDTAPWIITSEGPKFSGNFMTKSD